MGVDEITATAPTSLSPLPASIATTSGDTSGGGWLGVVNNLIGTAGNAYGAYVRSPSSLVPAAQVAAETPAAPSGISPGLIIILLVAGFAFLLIEKKA